MIFWNVLKTSREVNTLTTKDMRLTLELYGVATDNEIDLVTDINGYNEETMEDILYVRTGYRTFEQFLEEVEE